MAPGVLRVRSAVSATVRRSSGIADLLVRDGFNVEQVADGDAESAGDHLLRLGAGLSLLAFEAGQERFAVAGDVRDLVQRVVVPDSPGSEAGHQSVLL